MRKLIFKQGKLGFALAELLAVLLILVILIGLGVPGFLALRRKIKITEYDDIAREIYVAAQNQLTRLAANGMDDAAQEALATASPVPYGQKPSDYTDGGEWKREAYRYSAQGSNAMAYLLPLGAVSEDLRTNGAYVIEYNVETNAVYGVFYAEKTFDYDSISQKSGFRTSRDTRMEDMVGYYGGSAVERDQLTHCPTPQLSILNENILQLNILNAPTDTEMTIKLRISDGVNEVDVPQECIRRDSANLANKVVLLDSLNENEHFYQLFPSLIPGNDLTITVTFEKEGSISSSASITTNSLFASREPGSQPEEPQTPGVTPEKTGDTVNIAWARHLQNLEGSVSKLNDETISTARQIEHIEWLGEFGNFISIINTGTNGKLLNYEGNGLEIRDLRGTNGLFAETKETMRLSGIQLVNPQITADGIAPVGALAGTTAQGTTVSSCGVYYRKLNTNGTVNYGAYENCGVNGGGATTGGLIGQAQGTTVTNSFAALPYIRAEKGAALIGSASGCEITNSYANCDNLPVSTDFHYFLSGSGNDISHSYAIGSVNNDDEGTFAGSGNTVKDCYYAVSHKDWENDKDLALTEFYHIENDAWEKTDQAGMSAARDGWASLSAPLSHPYREYLDGRAFPYPAIAALDHYGSWPDDDGKVKVTVKMLMLNTDLDASNAAQVIIQDSEGELYDSKNPPEDNTIWVEPGAEITLTVKNVETGYKYVKSQVDVAEYFPKDGEQGKYEIPDLEIKKDTEIKVYFQQSEFPLHCLQVIDEDGKPLNNASYRVEWASNSPIIAGKEVDTPVQVETGTKVTVTPVLPDGKKVGVIWYTTDPGDAPNSRIYVFADVNGKYAFEMPGQETYLHVQYTTRVVKVKVDYYVMDTDGHYSDGSVEGIPDNPTKTAEMQYGVGTVITDSMIEALAENSGRLLTINGEKVLYLEKGEVYKKGSDQKITLPCTMKTEDEGDEKGFTIKIYIQRARYNIKLLAGDNIQDVDGKEDGFTHLTGDEKGVEGTFYYGKQLTGLATVIPGQNFTLWEPSDSRFSASSSTEYRFEVPYYNLTLTAKALKGQYLVTLNLLENEESWLNSAESRQADPVSVTLVNSLDSSKRFALEARTEDTASYVLQGVVPSIPELSEGYYIEVYYDSDPAHPVRYHSGMSEEMLLKVRDRAVVEDLNFYSVTYHANTEYPRGQLPKGGTYPQFHTLKIPGNIGPLRNDDTASEARIFGGWRDSDANTNGTTIYYGHEGEALYSVTRQTDFFANWVDSFRVMYNDNGADSGELPVDNVKYNANEAVTLKWGGLKRNGYRFIGWATTLANANAGTADYKPDETTQFNIGEPNVTLYAVWEREPYTIRFLDESGKELLDENGDPYTYTYKYYGDMVSAPNYAPTSGGTFIGWSTSRGGDVSYRAGDTVTVTGDQDYYPRVVQNHVKVTYHYNYDAATGQWVEKEVQFINGVPGYLECGEAGVVTAWSTQENLGEKLFLCQESTTRSLESVAFTQDTHLYAVTGKVFNVNQVFWRDTLCDAVNDPNTQAGDTLVVYRDTEETNRIEFTKDVYVLANGDRTVSWETATDSNIWVDNEFTGCMYARNCQVTFGKSGIASQTMNGTLTFDAAKKSRVMALGFKAEFNMYDGITLTNGYRHPPGEPVNWNSDVIIGNGYIRSFFGGGVFAGLDSVFNMRGGTISYCEAYRGGGVYLYGDRGQNKGSKMYMGEMVTPEAYSATAIYYDKVDKYYVNQSGVTAENYKDFLVAQGNPQICFNVATQVNTGRGIENNNNSFGNNDGGGGLVMMDLPDGFLELYKGSITNNEAYANGGGIMTDGGGRQYTAEGVFEKELGDEAELRIYEVDISHNRAGGCGGGIFQWQGVIYVYNSTLRQNYAGQSGGGIYLHHYVNGDYTENSDVEFYFGDISDNEAAENGGGVFVENGLDMWIYGGNLRNNKAGINGGGVYLSGEKSDLFLDNGAVYDNSSGQGHNDVYLNGKSVITAWEKGLNLITHNPGQMNEKIAVDGWNMVEDRMVVKYKEEDGTEEENFDANALFDPADADLFEYRPNGGEGDLYIIPTTDDTDGTLSAPLVLSKLKNGRTLQFFPNGGTWTTAGADFQEVQDPEGGTHWVIRVEANSGFTSFPIFTRDGYYLSGWAHSKDAYEEEYVAYYDANESKWLTKYDTTDHKWTEPKDTPVYKVTTAYDQKFYAIWQPYKVIYNLNGAPASVTPPAEGIGPKVQILGPGADEYTDETGVTYKFRGWSEDENATTPDARYDVGDEVTLTTDHLRLYAVWQPDQVKITFDFNETSIGDKAFEELTVIRGQKLEIPAFENLTKAGHIFGGWSTTEGSTNADFQTGDSIQTDETTEDMTLYAVWKEGAYVTFDPNYEGGSPTQSPLVEVGTEYTLPEPDARTGFNFLGWSEDPNDATKPLYPAEGTITVPIDGITLYAVWEALPLKVMFDLNGGEDPASFAPIPSKAGEQITIPSEEPTKTGYIFLGWKQGDTDTLIQPGANITFYEDVTLTAQWAKEVTITFDMNGHGESVVVPVPEGQTYTISIEDPLAAGYKFLGWSVNQDTTPGESDKFLQKGDTCESVDADITLYAQWEPVTPQPDPAPQPIPENPADPASEPAPEAPQPEPEPESDPAPAPEPESKPEPQSAPDPQSEPDPQSAPAPEQPPEPPQEPQPDPAPVEGGVPAE